MKINQHLELLGLPAEDKVTGYAGVVTSVSFDLFGCVVAALSPPVDKDGEITTGKWFDVTRLKITDTTPVMDRPDFEAGYIAEGKKGAADHPPVR